MKKVNLITMISSLFLISCGVVTKLPVSQTVPAADIKVNVKQDKSKNSIILLTAKNLAAPNRVDSTCNAYVLWINTKENGIKNLGQIINKNAKTIKQKFSTAFIPTEVTITLEKNGNVSAMSEKVITKAQLN